MRPERAREVLADLRYVWEQLELCSDKRDFRIRYVAAAVLVRLVGDALHKVDSGADSALAGAIELAFQTRQKDHQLFQDFIRCERDQLVHRYETGVYSGDTLVLGLEHDDAVDMEMIDECLFKPIRSGTFEGQDARDVLLDAIEWWEAEIQWIEFTAGREGSE